VDTADRVQVMMLLVAWCIGLRNLCGVGVARINKITSSSTPATRQKQTAYIIMPSWRNSHHSAKNQSVEWLTRIFCRETVDPSVITASVIYG